MTLDVTETDGRALIDREGLQALISALRDQGYEVIGPQVADGAIVYQPLASVDALPAGWADEQDGGRYRLVPTGDERLFASAVGPHSWKRYLFPSVQRLWQARRSDDGFAFTVEHDAPRYAFLGVRACELHAIQLQDKVFDNGQFADPGYLARRAACFIVAVNCSRAGGTCFCASMDSGPQVAAGFDLALTELLGDGRHDFLVEAGSERGSALLAALPHRTAGKADVAAAQAVVARAAAQMGREMVAEVAPLMRRNLEHPRWAEVAERCLRCGNCTLVCPTCFCSTTEDLTDLNGETASRLRKWDSCFTTYFSFIHGGSIRREGSSRYRQWMTHKLAHWQDQFGSLGCVGCGRCITWCPVGIDITQEARAIAASEGRL